MGCEIPKKNSFACRNILDKTMPFTLPNGKDGIVQPVSYKTVLGEVTNIFGTDITGVSTGTLVEVVLDYCVSHSRYFAGELNEEGTIEGKDELADLFHRIIEKDPNDTVLYKKDGQKATMILDLVLKLIDRQKVPSIEEIARETAKGMAIAKMGCNLGDDINRREVAGMFYIEARLLTMFMKEEPALMELWKNGGIVIDDEVTKQIIDPKIIGAMYTLVAAVSLDKEKYPILSKLFSNNLNKDGEEKITLFDNAEEMTHDYSK